MSKYKKVICGTEIGSKRPVKVVVDVYDVLDAFEVHCHATGHAIKKLLMAGKRGAKSAKQDLQESIQAIDRAIENVDRHPSQLNLSEFNPT